MFVIHAGKLIDGNGGAPRLNVSVFIEGGRIKAIESTSQVDPGPEIEVIDATGQTLMPA